ncbi:hypothetical protein AB205_0154370, partial [Aquarana catesbeiana]
DVTAQISLQPALKFNGGGHVNHSIFWTNLSPSGGGEPQGELLKAITSDFGSFEKFKDKLTAMSVAVQGSGWGWLGYNKESNRLQVTACANQDPLQGTTGLIPLLGIDVWEHAYYLQYKNVRPDYLKAIWNVINWQNFPSNPEQWQDVAAQFLDQWDFPNCGGAIHGKHVRIVPPPNSGSYYFNYKGFCSIVMLALVSANYEFWYLDVGKNGRNSD